MSWLTSALHELAAGRAIRLRGSGTSMTGRIDDGEFVTIEPVSSIADVGIDDIVFVQVQPGRFLVHLVKQIAKGRYLIGNMRGEIDGWVEPSAIVGKVNRIGGDESFDGKTLEDRDEAG